MASVAVGSFATTTLDYSQTFIERKPLVLETSQSLDEVSFEIDVIGRAASF